MEWVMGFRFRVTGSVWRRCGTCGKWILVNVDSEGWDEDLVFCRDCEAEAERECAELWIDLSDVSRSYKPRAV